jgi:poly(3-hydroxybutyrate) depolymerase
MGSGGATAGSGGATGAGGASAGCGMSGAPTGVMQMLSITVAGTARAYVLSVPTSYSSATRYPLIFGWHGLGGNGMQSRQYFRVESSAANQAIFVYPTALPNTSGQNAWDLGASGVDVQLFDALVADVTGKYCVDNNRIFSTGHSYGGFFTNRLGCTRGNVLRAIAPVAGGPPFGGGTWGTCMGAVGAWMTHGDNDPTVEFTQGEAARDRFRMANGCATTTMPVDPMPCVAYDGCMPDLPVHWCVHQDMHNWPSFAGLAIWNFFNTFK